ncbi:alpha/beta fold hydrolase [Patescibacteria group bacterium]|nr:alpha/beta fold hydrolase [Patescibacteria group bacterium]
MRKRHFFLVLAVVLYLTLLALLFFLPSRQNGILISPLGQNFFNKPRPLEKYSFENLKKREYQGSEIKLEKVLQEENFYTSWLFSFQSDGKKVTGMLNLPKKQGQLPVIVMLRGYADDEIYFTGLGTRKAAGVFAENGFITLAPDFLGFGGSDTSSLNILEARFERPITVLNLLASIKSLEKADPEKIFMWGHSNGGQIALSALEISQKPIPTVLWAPVAKGFPGSVLQYMGGMDDQGLKVKKAIDDFLNLYESKYYSIDQYWQDIKAPLQIHQGTADEYIQTEWTDNFVQTLKDLGKEVTYYKYPRNDHNLSRDWDTVVSRDLQFFQKFL